MTTFYEKKVNTKDRKEMIAFLKNHFRYDTMNSWNRSTSYANNVKIYNLGITDDVIHERAYAIVLGNIDTSILWDAIKELEEQFFQETGYYAGFNGRHSGYYVLYQAEMDDADNAVVYPGLSIDEPQDMKWEELSDTQLQNRVELVCRFDRLTDEVRDTFLWWAEHGRVEILPIADVRRVLAYPKK